MHVVRISVWLLGVDMIQLVFKITGLLYNWIMLAALDQPMVYRRLPGKSKALLQPPSWLTFILMPGLLVVTFTSKLWAHVHQVPRTSQVLILGGEFTHATSRQSARKRRVTFEVPVEQLDA